MKKFVFICFAIFLAIPCVLLIFFPAAKVGQILGTTYAVVGLVVLVLSGILYPYCKKHLDSINKDEQSND